MRLDIARIEQIGGMLLEVAGAFVPGASLVEHAAQLKQLLEAGSELNGLLTQIKNQTDAESAAVWDAVRSDYSEAVDQFKASVDAHT